jgi:uncharacterized integral membrane protein (TIGR00698 family)
MTQNRLALAGLSALCLLLLLTPMITAAMALVLGAGLAVTLGNPCRDGTKRLTPHLLAISIVGLGAGMNLEKVLSVGLHGLWMTALGIVLALAAGLTIGRLLRTDRDTSILITAGTAICGGSAIAALVPVLKAKPSTASVALGTVFILNAVALATFPAIGHLLHLSEAQFGLWGALAIHDTSSVVGATSQYGPLAAETGITVKLARALWIIPLTLLVGLIYAPKGEPRKIKLPWFIPGFLLAAALVHWVPALQPAGQDIAAIARRLLVLALFFIGLGLTRETLKAVGLRPFLQGVLVWILVATCSLLAIQLGWIA